ncbi:hypothetical protein [Coleofasciculus sp.]|uniref:hypothetical protein n=1 Tax=Coleofasciculus sp. TaxID=3100458 RepID=UPI0039FB401E
MVNPDHRGTFKITQARSHRRSYTKETVRRQPLRLWMGARRGMGARRAPLRMDEPMDGRMGRQTVDILPRLKSAGDSSPRHLFRGGR